MVSKSTTGLKALTQYFTYAEIGKQGLGSGKVGDFANINELEGNIDILENIEGTLGVHWNSHSNKGGWKPCIVSADDESTWPAWARREAQGFDTERLIVNFECPCSTPTPVEDPFKGEVYCQECGCINDGLQHFDEDMDMDHAEDEYEEEYDIWTDSELVAAFGPDALETEEIYDEHEVSEQKPPPLEIDAQYITETNMTVTVRNMMTGEYVTKVIQKISNIRTPNSEEIELGATKASLFDRKIWYARKKFNDHFAECDGHPGNCPECHRTDKRLQKLIAQKLH